MKKTHTTNSKSKDNLSDFYNDYDYMAFWHGRTYENHADEIAISRLLSIIKKDKLTKYSNFIDIGCGPGRMVHLYEPLWNEITLLDSSADQLKEAQEQVKDRDKSDVVLANAQKIPLQDDKYDAALCIRVFHYIYDPAEVFKEMNRILKPNGYLILEIPNKLNIKNRIRLIFMKDRGHASSNNEILRSKQKENIVFINHDPRRIETLLKLNKFEIVEILSVSNFRSPFLKKIFPISFLVFIEKFTQKELASLWFGPSIYFLVKKKY